MKKPSKKKTVKRKIKKASLDDLLTVLNTIKLSLDNIEKSITSIATYPIPQINTIPVINTTTWDSNNSTVAGIDSQEVDKVISDITNVLDMILENKNNSQQ